MAIKIFSKKDISEEKWNRLTDSSFLSSVQFASLWRAKKGKPIFFVDEEDGLYKAGLCGVVFGGGLFKRFDSMPDGLYGGVFFEPDYKTTRQAAFIEKFENYLRQNNFLRAHINKADDKFGKSAFKKSEVIEHILELSDTGFVASKKEVRKHIRGSKERGAVVSLLTEKNDLEPFYNLALHSEKDHNRKLIYPFEFFEKLLILSLGNSSVLWLKSTLENKIIASQITFFEKDYALNWAFYFDREYGYYKPAYLLADYAIEKSIEKGIKYFSMGATPGQIESVVKYKERWGGREQTYNIYSYYNLLGKLIGGRRRR